MTLPRAVGGGAVLLPGRPTPDAVLDVMRRHRPTVFAGVPTLYAALLAHPETGPCDGLRRCISAGEPLPEHVGLRWRDKAGVHILDGIGSTDMPHIFLSDHPDDTCYATTRQP